MTIATGSNGPLDSRCIINLEKVVMVSRVVGLQKVKTTCLAHNPLPQPGHDIRTLPTYTIPEPAAFLAIKRRTMSSWYEGDEPILRASGNYGSTHLLSYKDL